MTFHNAVMLAGLAVVVLPLVLRLLARSRGRSVAWGAMMLLPAGFAATSGGRWLTALRMLALATLVVALARPALRSPPGPARAEVVIVLDASASMSHPQLNDTRLGLAKRVAFDRINTLRPGDQAGLVVLGAPPGQDVPPTGDLQDVATRIAAQSVAPGFADLGDGLRRARSLLRGGDAGKSIDLIADRQRETWTPLRDVPPDESIKVIAHAVGDTQTANCSVESVALGRTPALAGRPLTVAVELRNWSDLTRSDVPLSIRVDDREIDTARVYLPAHGAVRVERVVVLPKPGPAVLTATIEDAGVTSDNVASLAIETHSVPRVTAVTGGPPTPRRGAPELSGEADLLKLALIPHAVTRRPGDDAFRFRSLPAAEWPELNLRADRMVALLDVTAVDAAQTAALEHFVYAGGGLLLVPGASTNPANWNATLWKDGSGLAPARLDPARKPATTDIDPASMAEAQLTFQPLTSATSVRHEATATFERNPDARTLLQFDDGRPALLARTFGRGRVMALAVPVGGPQAYWADSPAFLPLVQSIAAYLSFPPETPRNLSPGEVIRVTVDAPRDGTALVISPQGRVERVLLSPQDGLGRLRFDDTDLPGRYTVRMPWQPAIDFLVHGPRTESAFDAIGDAELRPLLRPSGAALAGEAGTDWSRRFARLEWAVVFLAVTALLLAAECLAALRMAKPAGAS